MKHACIFCRIAAGEIPCTVLDESEHLLAILDVNPAFPGHTLIIPRAHEENIFRADTSVGAELLDMMRRVGAAVTEATGATGLNIIQNNGRSAWQTVDHLHWHLIPRREGDGFEPWKPGIYDSHTQMKTMAEKIRAAMVRRRQG
ncbi:HIT family protein [Mailhella massiliensis]|uniref:HIT family protein n=1 Tax=Mailhella massiliensis TaxID=1903261 RepID=UPI00097DF345|nr:HIT family protein [Mailhella massiliensis]